MDYQEGLCKVIVAGQEFEAWGALVTPERVVGYLGPLMDQHFTHGVLQGCIENWHGEPLGTYTVVRRWCTPRSSVNLEMWQVEATVDGVMYTGRSTGVGMVFKGKVIKHGKRPSNDV